MKEKISKATILRLSAITALIFLMSVLTGCIPANPTGSPTNPNKPFTFLNLSVFFSTTNSGAGGTWTPTNTAPISVTLPAYNTGIFSPISSGSLTNLPTVYTDGTGDFYAGSNSSFGIPTNVIYLPQTNLDASFGPTTSYQDVVSRNPENFLVVASVVPTNLFTSLTYEDYEGVFSPKAVGKIMGYQTGAAGSGTLTIYILRRPDKTGLNSPTPVIGLPSNLNGAIIDATIPISITVK